MNTLFLIARAIVILLSLSSIIGMIWFIDSLTLVLGIAGFLCIISGLLVAVTPRNLIATKIIKSVFKILSVVGLISLGVLLVNDLSYYSNTDWGALIIRSVLIACFTLITYEITKLDTSGRYTRDMKSEEN